MGWLSKFESHQNVSNCQTKQWGDGIRVRTIGNSYFLNIYPTSDTLHTLSHLIPTISYKIANTAESLHMIKTDTSLHRPLGGYLQ